MGSCQGSPSVTGSVQDLNISLHYFDVYGKAEPHRMLLNHAGVSFTDSRF